MALLPRSLRRPTAILKMPQAIAKGLTASGFLEQLKRQGLGYRKTLFLQDWRSVAGIEAKKDRRKYTRKDRVPKIKEIADVEWDLSKEYMHKAAVYSRTRPGEPLTERFVNIMSDTALTGQQVIDTVFERWTGYEKYGEENLVRVIPTDVYHRVEPQGSLEI